VTLFGFFLGWALWWVEEVELSLSETVVFGELRASEALLNETPVGEGCLLLVQRSGATIGDTRCEFADFADGDGVADCPSGKVLGGAVCVMAELSLWFFGVSISMSV